MPLAPVQPVVLTGRFVRLEPLEERHRAGLWAIAGLPEIWPFMPADGSNPGGFERLFDAALAERNAGRQLPFVVRLLADDRLAGSTRYLNLSPADGRLEIGWTWYGRPWWGGPVNPEAKLLLLDHAFAALGASRVELRCDARNTRSRAAIAKLGAVEEGVLRRHQRVQHGFLRDTVVFAILDTEWPAVRAGLAARVEAFAADDSA